MRSWIRMKWTATKKRWWKPGKPGKGRKTRQSLNNIFFQTSTELAEPINHFVLFTLYWTSVDPFFSHRSINLLSILCKCGSPGLLPPFPPPCRLAGMKSDECQALLNAPPFLHIFCFFEVLVLIVSILWYYTYYVHVQMYYEIMKL
jgi:hypothetical protein